MSGLGLPVSGDGNFIKYIKFNAKSGRWYTKNDAGDEFEVSQMTAVFDMPNIKTGVMKFAAGMAPDYIFDTKIGTGDAQAPEGVSGYKRGFRILVFAEKAFNGVREFAATAGIVNDAMNALWDAYDAAPEKAQGQVPIVSCTAITPVESKHGTNYAPTLSIVGWAARPGALDTVEAEATAKTASGAATTATTIAPGPATDVPPPASAPQTAPATAPAAGGTTEF